MANRYGGITGSKKISEDWNNINIAFDKVQADVDAKAATVNTHIANADIHVTKTDKTKWDGHVANADIHVTSAQKAAWDAKADGSTSTELAAHIADQEVHVTQADHDKLNGIEAGAQVNQNAFSKVNDIEAADPSSQFYIVGGIGITVTTNPNTGEITVTATGDAAPGAHGPTHTEHGADPIPTATLQEGGLLSAAQLAEIVAHGELLDEHATAITALEDRLDDAEVDQLTLQPGLQVIHAERDSRFRLGEIRGKTEINGQGRIGLIGVENPYIIRKASEDEGAEILSMLAFQTELHANPEDDSDPDVLFEQDGEYLKLAKWKKVVLDGALPWADVHASGSGFKNLIVSISSFPAISGINQGFLMTYKGTSLPPSDANSEGGFYDDGGNLVVSVPNLDSGWGDNYTPTPSEIKAYFNGWRMCDANTAQLYTDAPGEVKCWGAIAHPANQIGSPGWIDPVVNNVPTYRAPTLGGYEYHPYNLLYRLAKELAVPVTAEGCLTLAEGDNVVEVGTGIVLREGVKPKQHANTNWIINNMGVRTSLSNKVSAIKAIYRDSRRDYKWVKEAVIGAWGIEQAYINNANYDQSAAYSVTYLKLDKSPVVPISGSLAANEKAQISDLTAGVAEALQRVSVVEQKKAEKDVPGWIKPVLLNGWLDYSSNYPAAFFKDSSGVVYIRGLIKSGATVSDTIIFTLPPGYRPKTANMQIPQVTLDGSTESVGRIMIDTLGHVRVGKASTGFLTLHASFLAEQ